MPNILQRLESQLRAKGKDKASAHRIAVATLQRSGSIKKGSDSLTAKGRARSAMGAAGRAKDRASKVSGHKASEYSYNARSNTARLRK